MLFMIVMAVIAILSGITVKPLIGGFRQINAHFFFLGAGFLLVQVQSISKMAFDQRQLDLPGDDN